MSEPEIEFESESESDIVEAPGAVEAAEAPDDVESLIDYLSDEPSQVSDAVDSGDSSDDSSYASEDESDVLRRNINAINREEISRRFTECIEFDGLAGMYEELGRAKKLFMCTFAIAEAFLLAAKFFRKDVAIQVLDICGPFRVFYSLETECDFDYWPVIQSLDLVDIVSYYGCTHKSMNTLESEACIAISMHQPRVFEILLGLGVNINRSTYYSCFENCDAQCLDIAIRNLGVDVCRPNYRHLLRCYDLDELKERCMRDLEECMSVLFKYNAIHPSYLKNYFKSPGDPSVRMYRTLSVRLGLFKPGFFRKLVMRRDPVMCLLVTKGKRWMPAQIIRVIHGFIYS